MIDDLRLLREFRAGIPAPDETTRRMAYAYATNSGESSSQPSRYRLGAGRWEFGRRAVAIAVLLIALLIAAVAIAGPSLFGLSNHGKRAHATAFNREELNGHLFFTESGIHLGPANIANPDTLVRLAFRDGIGVYAARSQKGNRRCYYDGEYYPKPDPHPDRLHLSGSCGPYIGSFALPERLTNLSGRKGERQQNTWLRTHPFPSPARPVLVLSERPFVGVAANGVRSLQLLALSDCHPVVTVPVIGNVYIDAHPPSVSEAFIVARDASGKVIWHSAKSYMTNQYERVPNDRKLPQNCGLR